MRARPILLIVLLCLGIACRRGQAPESAGGPAEAPAPVSAPAPPIVDQAADDRFAFMAGLPVDSTDYAPLREEPSWQGYAEQVGKAWGEFDAKVLQPMGKWAADVLEEARRTTRVLFYPFGGPDFTTAATLFPTASKTVLLGLEPVGNLPDFGRTTPEWRTEFFSDLGELAQGFLKRGYFITMHMNDTYGRAKVDGALPVIALFLKRSGYAIAGVKRLIPDADGGWTITSYERLGKRPRRPYGAKIDYFKPGDGESRSVYYISCDLEDKALQKGTPLYRFFEALGTMTTFVKSGSYLLHWSNFSTLRGLILDRSQFVLQDDTAIPYRFFMKNGWDVRLFGRYATPVKDFTNVEQKDLRDAYESPGAGVKPLPFHFGYRWVTQVDNLLLAKRPRRPDKVPVDGR